MKANVGFLDRFIRIFLGVVAVAVAVAGVVGAPWNMVLGVVGAVMLFTGIIKFCPAYILFGINTCGTESSGDKH